MPIIEQGPEEIFASQRQRMEEADTGVEELLAKLEDLPPVASMVVPGAVTLLVNRKKHPILWTIFGAIPLGFAGVRAVSTGRLF